MSSFLLRSDKVKGSFSASAPSVFIRRNTVFDKLYSNVTICSQDKALPHDHNGIRFYDDMHEICDPACFFFPLYSWLHIMDNTRCPRARMPHTTNMYMMCLITLHWCRKYKQSVGFNFMENLRCRESWYGHCKCWDIGTLTIAVLLKRSFNVNGVFCNNMVFNQTDAFNMWIKSGKCKNSHDKFELGTKTATESLVVSQAVYTMIDLDKFRDAENLCRILGLKIWHRKSW